MVDEFCSIHDEEILFDRRTTDYNDNKLEIYIKSKDYKDKSHSSLTRK